MIPEALLLEAAKPLISSLVNNIVTPKILKFAEKVNVAYNELLIPRGEHFEEYLHRNYKKYSIINTLVFKNEQRLLKDLYIPLTITKEELNRTGEKEQLKIEKYPKELIDKYMQIPNAAHEQTGEQKKMWKNKIYRKNEQNLQINP